MTKTQSDCILNGCFIKPMNENIAVLLPVHSPRWVLGIGIRSVWLRSHTRHELTRNNVHAKIYIENPQNENGFVKYAYFWKIQKGGSNAPSLGSESKYANGLDDPRLNAAVFKEKGKKNSSKIQIWEFW